MRIIAEVGIMAGRCVRIDRGDFANPIDYGDPIEWANRFAKMGHDLYLIDQDGAYTGMPCNMAKMSAIREQCPDSTIYVGGGIRSEGMAEEYTQAGFDKVVCGMFDHPGKDAIIAMDVKAIGNDWVVFSHGWKREVGSMSEVFRQDPERTFLINTWPDSLGAAGIYRQYARTYKIIASGLHPLDPTVVSLENHGCIGVVAGQSLYERAHATA